MYWCTILAKADPIPYFSAQSAIKAGRESPSYTTRSTPTPRQTPISFDQASTARLDSGLSQNLIVSESTTFEELTTITTSKWVHKKNLHKTVRNSKTVKKRDTNV